MLDRTADLPMDRIRQFCETHHVRRLRLFGSILRSDFKPDSDIDVLVEFEPGTPVTFFDMVNMQTQLESILGRKVDFLTPGFLSEHFRQQTLDEAQTIYERR